MRKAAILLFITGLLVNSSTSLARVIRDGNMLLETCTENSNESEIACLAYIEGISDVMTQYSPVGNWKTCIPEDQTINQIKSIILSKLDQSPKLLQYDAASVILAILDEAFPCAN